MPYPVTVRHSIPLNAEICAQEQCETQRAVRLQVNAPCRHVCAARSEWWGDPPFVALCCASCFGVRIAGDTNAPAGCERLRQCHRSTFATPASSLQHFTPVAIPRLAVLACLRALMPCVLQVQLAGGVRVC